MCLLQPTHAQTRPAAADSEPATSIQPTSLAVLTYYNEYYKLLTTDARELNIAAACVGETREMLISNVRRIYHRHIQKWYKTVSKC